MNIMSNITNFIKRLFGIKSEKTITVKVNQSTLDDIKKYHNLDGKNEIEQVIKNHYKSDLNEITLKMNVTSDKKPAIDDKPKKKRYYKKKTTNNKNTTTTSNKKETVKTKSPETGDTTKKTNGTTKRKYKSKKPKQTQTVQHQQRVD